MSRLHAGPFTDGLYTVSMDDFVVSNSPIASAPVGAKVLAKPAVSAPRQQATFSTGKDYKAGCTITSYYTSMGSASVATDAGGNKIAGSDTRYVPFGEARSGFAGSGLPTDRRFIPQIATLTRDVPQGKSVSPAG